uniref:Uncharacterized protein n=1 Tax=Panagrolaimus sp. PS1159 TaxID=55785 RepID=A0AC35F5K4_9BILA
MEDFPDYLCSTTSLPSTTTLREKLAEYFDSTKSLIEKLSDDDANKRSKKADFGDDSSTDEDEQIPSVSKFTTQQEIITKLRNLFDAVEESTWILAALSDIKFNQCNQLECDIEKRNDEILFLQKKITELKSSSKFSTSNWSSLSPEALSLRRSHDSRLDYVCKMKRELTHEKHRNELLLRKQTEIQADSAAIQLSFQIECDRLKEELYNEKQKNDSNNSQILYLKKRLMEEKAKSRNRANRFSKVNKNSVKLLQRQLCALNVSGNNKIYQLYTVERLCVYLFKIFF